MRSERRSVLHNTWVYLKYLSFCVVILCVFTFCVPCCDVRYDFQLFVGGLMSYLHYLCLFAYSVVQHILCCVGYFSPSFVPYVRVSLGCPFLIVPSVFSNVYSAIFLTNNKSCCGIDLWKYVIISTGKNEFRRI